MSLFDEVRKVRIDKATNVMEALCAVGHPIMLEEWGDPRTCIASTKLAIGELKRHGIDAVPVPVRVVVCNPLAVENMEKGIVIDDPSKGMAMACGYQDPTEVDEGHYNGHLILAVSGEHVLDITADQFARPEYNIDIRPHHFTVGPEFLARQVREIEQSLANGGLVSYSLNPDPSWADSWDWRLPEDAEMVARVEQAIDAYLAANPVASDYRHRYG